MALTFEFCEARALEAATAAEDAKLDNVRDRALRSEAAWKQMAERIKAVHAQRKTILKERSESLF